MPVFDMMESILVSKLEWNHTRFLRLWVRSLYVGNYHPKLGSSCCLHMCLAIWSAATEILHSSSRFMDACRFFSNSTGCLVPISDLLLPGSFFIEQQIQQSCVCFLWNWWWSVVRDFFLQHSPSLWQWQFRFSEIWSDSSEALHLHQQLSS